MDRYKMQDCVQWRLGRGNRIHFWLDEEVIDGRLKNQFPRIYAIAQSKNMFIEDPYRVTNGNSKWIVNVNRNLNDVEEYEAMLLLLSTLHVNEGMDQIEWKLKQNGEFTVKSYYKYLLNLC